MGIPMSANSLGSYQALDQERLDAQAAPRLVQVEMIAPMTATSATSATSATWTVDDMRDHVLSLAQARDLVVKWVKRTDKAYALHECEEVGIAPIRSPITYAVALHELGHILGRHQRSAKVIVRERWAWRWARKNAIRWTPSMERHAQTSLAWYEAHHRRATVMGDATSESIWPTPE